MIRELVDVGDPGIAFEMPQSCWICCPSGAFAQDLANELGVTVLAPTTEIGASGSGKTLEFYDGGVWRWFEPVKRR